jgi:transposase
MLKNNKSFTNVVKKLSEIAETGVAETRKTAVHTVSEAEMLKYGYIPYLRLWMDLGIGHCINRLQGETRCTFQIGETAFLMAVQHLLSPKSKLATYDYQEAYIGLKQAELQHLYRTLDKLGEYKEKIEDELFHKNFTKIGHKVDVVFYDVTTFAFESFIADELRNFGFSKECKFKEVQVVMGLLIDLNGLPIGYELFPGNTFDGKTMVGALGNIKKRFGINKVIIVADRGINSKGNLNLIKSAGYGYIVASKIKTMKRKIIDTIFDDTGYITVSQEFRYKTIDYVNTFKDENGEKHELVENLIVSHSEKRAEKDKSDRERLIKKAEKMLSHPSLIKSSARRGGKKYLSPTNDTAHVLDEKAIGNDSRFDGYYGIQTSEKEMTAAEIIEAYRSLWKIEESFRIMKSSLQVRPVFHWKPERIHGHFVVCFHAFMMERRLEMLLSEGKIEQTNKKIREALNDMQLAKVTLDGDEVFIKARNKQLANQICQILKIKQPQNINSSAQVFETLNLQKKDSWGQLSLV